MIFENPNFYIVSGGPGCGKTTLLRELSRLGYHHAPEVARQIIQEQVHNGGTALPWHDRESYAGLMLERSIESYLAHLPAAKITFADRGIPDTLCYARLIGLRKITSIENACRQYRYAPVVFLAPPWQEIYETDDERKQDFAEAERSYEEMIPVYRGCRYDLEFLPKATPAARAAFILERIREKIEIHHESIGQK